MALQDRAFKSVSIIVGIALLAAVILVISAIGSRKTPDVITKNAYKDDVSGLIFEVPLDWTFGRDKLNKIQLSSGLISQIQTQKSDCSNFSPEISQSIKAALGVTSSQATQAWKKQYPGLEGIKLYNSIGEKRILIGIDICNSTLTTKKIMLRGQIYTQNVEVKLLLELPQQQEASSSELQAIAQALSDGKSNVAQDDYSQFTQVLLSVR